ncbi:MAG: formate dehydrogenase accessory sulfurtransferase FdhD [Candidatus Eisenbacteria bacterium]|nr:formate dehydrogenase accessory sulfurtransferase FdhD [Candidatus Eisenbacteria bacterium]
MSDPQVVRRPVTRVTGRSHEPLDDALAVERPLEMRVDGQALAVTLRTPGFDRELALGFLAGENVIRSSADVVGGREESSACQDAPDIIDLLLKPGHVLDWSKLERHFMATAACGLCGRAHLDAMRAGLTPVPEGPRIDTELLLALPARVRTQQTAFEATGGLHAAVWCDAAMEPRVLREDVGRHNAVDKVCGWLLEQGRRPVGEGLLWVSGRAGAELVLKAARAGIPTMASVGAPSSLAVELAEAAGMTLIGFLREGRMNVYCGQGRLQA